MRGIVQLAESNESSNEISSDRNIHSQEYYESYDKKEKKKRKEENHLQVS